MSSIYQDTLTYMYEQLPMFTRIGDAAYKADLDNTIKLCNVLGNPHEKFKSIHIAGTNGKGSTSHMLAAILQTAGFKTGLYTSPHIADFRERMTIDGIQIAEQDVIDFIEKNKKIIEEIKPSFFEITVAMVFDFFAKEKVDIAVIEVGLGGLLDSTNIIIPELSVITNISIDHTNLLGNTLQEIASQKAGIIKNRVPVVIGETQPEIQNIFFTQAIMHQTQVFYADTLYEIVGKKNENGKMQLRVLNKSSYVLKEIELDLNGDYQLKNLKTVLTAIDILHSMGWTIKEVDVLTALSNVKNISHIMGRFDIVNHNPYIIFDVSHNEAGLKEVFSQIENMQFRQLYIITGFAKDKAIDDILKLFPKEAYCYFTQADIPRALPYKELYEKATNIHMEGEAVENITMALEKAIQRATLNDLILVTGSFYLLSDAYLYMKNVFSLKK